MNLKKSLKRVLGILVMGQLLIGCSSEKPEGIKDENSEVLKKISVAHGLESWKKTKVLQSDIKIVFGGKEILNGTLSFETNGGRTRLDLDSGVIVFDGKTVFVSPASATIPRSRFHSLTWSWFLAAPFKIAGTGTNLSSFKEKSLPNGRFLTSRQTFESGEGDTPDDWYQLYVDPKNHLLKQMAYIVTYGKSLEEAEKKVSVIQYDDYIKLEGASVSTRWTFNYFSLNEGVLAQKGVGTISNLKFLNADSNLFNLGDDVKEVLLK